MPEYEVRGLGNLGVLEDQRMRVYVKPVIAIPGFEIRLERGGTVMLSGLETLASSYWLMPSRARQLPRRSFPTEAYPARIFLIKRRRTSKLVTVLR